MTNDSITNSLTIEQSVLATALSTAIKAVQRKNNIPILSHLLLEVDNEELKISATDLDMQISTAIACASAASFATVLPGHILNDTVKKLAGVDQITIKNGDGASTLEADRTSFKFQTMSPTDFPTMEKGEDNYSFTLSFQDFDNIINSVLFAASTEETRYYLNGIHLHANVEEKALIAVATDGHRLAKLNINIDDDISNMPAIIVPRSLWHTVKGVFSEKEDIKIHLSSSKIILEQSTISIVSKLIDGTFPEYQRVIPEKNEHCYIINKNALTAAINRVSTIHSERGHVISFSFNDGKLTLTTKETALGEARAEIDLLDGSAKEDITIGFNGRYALDMLAAIKADTIIFKLADKISPARIEVTGDTATTFVLMPMRL